MQIAATTFAAIFVATIFSGCAAKKAPPTLKELEGAEIGYLDTIIETQHSMQDRLVARLDREYLSAVAAGTSNDRVYDALILSGGGAKGAFGAGFLVGWGEVTDPAMRRPRFDFVSGVSTGNLIAPMAFVGDQSSYDLANETFRNPQPDWVKSRGVFDVLFDRDSLQTNVGLFKTIQATIGSRIPQIADGGEEDRILAIASVNVNQGLTQVWDLCSLASEVEAGRMTIEEFCQHSLASASIPLVFPPQNIDNNLYVDGSTTSDILLPLDGFRTVPSIKERWNRLHPGVPLPKFRIWVIANTTLFVKPVPVDSSDLAVVGRSLDLAVQAGLLSQLKTLELFTDLFRSEGLDFEFRYVAMPDGYTETGKGMFNKDDMQAMSDLGMKMGRDTSVWQTRVPNLLVPIQLRDHLQSELDTSAAKARPKS